MRVNRDYSFTSSVTAMLKDLNWRLKDQRCIDNRLAMLHKVTYDLLAIPASQCIFPRSIIHLNVLPELNPVLPTLTQSSSAVCQVFHVSP